MKTVFRIITYNIFGFRMLKRYSISDFADAIAALEPDVVCLQEVDEGRVVKRKKSPVKEIAKKLKMNLEYHPVYKLDCGSTFGNAILTSHPIKKRGEGSLPGKTWKSVFEKRGVVWTEVDFHGTPVQILNTHLSFWKSEQSGQMNTLLNDWVYEDGSIENTILTGDFNVGHKSKFLNPLKETMNCATKEKRMATWPSQNPFRQLDYIFTSKDLEMIRCLTPKEKIYKRISDHLPIVVDFSIPGLKATEARRQAE